MPNWSQIADIHLLSNHRTEWLFPTMATISEFIKSVTISSAVGFCKPHREIYDSTSGDNDHCAAPDNTLRKAGGTSVSNRSTW